MQYSLLQDVFPRNKVIDNQAHRQWETQECDRTAPRRQLSYDTAARRMTVPGVRTNLPDCMPKPVGEPSSLRNLLSSIYEEQGPNAFLSLLPKPFVENLADWRPRCPPTGNLYTRQGLFVDPSDPFAEELNYDRRRSRLPAPPSVRSTAYQNSRDDHVVNIILYAVTLGLVALVIIDTIMRFKR